MSSTQYSYMNSPIGRLLVAGDENGLQQIFFESEKKGQRPQPGWVQGKSLIRKALEQLQAYFAGELREFKLDLAPAGSPFQLRVWQALRAIPYGETISYGELARRIGNPRAPRAVGAANGQNPLPIVVPCHRVIGSSGALVGFGGGLDVKAKLLALERQFTARPAIQPDLWPAAAAK
jgi:methylated-DNA-[protein]-cysteine S-methyltransferase